MEDVKRRSSQMSSLESELREHKYEGVLMGANRQSVMGGCQP